MKWTIAAVSCLVVGLATEVYADDVNRTGQTQSVDTGKSGTATKGGDANTMGGGNATSTLPSQQPQVAPPNGTQPAPDETHINSEPNSSSGAKN